MIVHFKDWKCYALGDYYANGRKAISLVDVIDGEPIATATVNLPDIDLPNDTVFVKDYSENEGMLNALVNAQIVKPFVLSTFKSGYIYISAFILTKDAISSLWDSDKTVEP